VVNSSGNVGIGTTSPATKLHVTGVTQIAESGNSAFYGGNYVRVFNDQNFNIRNVSGTTVANISVSGNSYFNGGNVGIGTTSPISKLTVLAASTGYSSDSQIKISDGSTSYYGGLSFDDSGATRLSIRNSYDGTGSVIGFGFGSSTDKVQIVDGTGLIVNEGNVGIGGIGTTSPSALLHVAGEARIDNTGASVSNQYTPTGSQSVENVIGNNEDNNVLGTPDVWLRINVGGTNYVFPGYTEP
jgi:hypothetical protein